VLGSLHEEFRLHKRWTLNLEECLSATNASFKAAADNVKNHLHLCLYDNVKLHRAVAAKTKEPLQTVTEN
jgi:hypothetical protein